MPAGKPAIAGGSLKVVSNTTGGTVNAAMGAIGTGVGFISSSGGAERQAPNTPNSGISAYPMPRGSITAINNAAANLIKRTIQIPFFGPWFAHTIAKSIGNENLAYEYDLELLGQGVQLAIASGASGAKGAPAGEAGAGSVASTAPKGGFSLMMDATEAARYNAYWTNDAPMRIAPGSAARMDWLRISNRTGLLEESRVIYDKFGHQIYRIDFADHGLPLEHSIPHLHQYEWGRQWDVNKGHRLNIVNFWGE